jgi:hypothetical protein
MKYFRLTTLHRQALPVLAVLMILRSLVAPGLSIENNNRSSGLMLTFCTSLIEHTADRHTDEPGQDGQTHVDPGHVYDLTESVTSDSPMTSGLGHEHDIGHGLSNSHCGLWTASGTYVTGNLHDPAGWISYMARDVLKYEHESAAINPPYYLRHSPRAPPRTLI